MRKTFSFTKGNKYDALEISRWLKEQLMAETKGFELFKNDFKVNLEIKWLNTKTRKWQQ